MDVLVQPRTGGGALRYVTKIERGDCIGMETHWDGGPAHQKAACRETPALHLQVYYPPLVTPPLGSLAPALSFPLFLSLLQAGPGQFSPPDVDRL